ncbi:MAG: hypothetical protein MJ189_00645 [Coriobacteriales bacterium]|nr:hypothetical protein [Coriobacteriales bacterium]
MQRIKIINYFFVAFGFSLIFCIGCSIFAFASQKNIDFCTIQPSYMYESWQTGDEHISLPEDASDMGDIIPAAVRKCQSRFPSFTYSTSLKDDQVKCDAIEQIHPNQIVIWQGHGDWDEVNSLIILETDTAFSTYSSDPAYTEDIANKLIVEVPGGYYAGITPGYIDKYGGDMSGSFIYLGSCESGHEGNTSLAQAFLNKGAAAVIVNTHTIQANYGNIMQYTVTTLLTEINPTTGNYYLLGDALAKAKSIYGTNDLEKGWYPAALGAEPFIVGDANWRVAQVDPPAPTPDPEPQTDVEILDSKTEPETIGSSTNTGDGDFAFCMITIATEIILSLCACKNEIIQS